MNILLLGNGYDLYYKLPTSYRNFLLTVDFLTKKQIEDIHTIGDVFGDEELSEQDSFIKLSYEVYRDTYDKIKLDTGKVEEIVEAARNNIWFSYFLKSFNKDVGWIDFETEIAYVLRCFTEFFANADVISWLDLIWSDNKDDTNGRKYTILKCFDFFIEHTPSLKERNVRVFIAADYQKEYPMGSQNHVIDKEKIIGKLHQSLLKFTSILQIYLQEFIEKTVKVLIEDGIIEQLEALKYTEAVVTFNYTNTYELLIQGLQKAEVFHVHGKVERDIVLGINANESDTFENINTDFVKFKKYYQRAVYDTDREYIEWMRKHENGSLCGNSLLVMGHSLDITDEDFIRELFYQAEEITILYHNEAAKTQYIEKIIRMFGKSEFEVIRRQQKLSFLPLDGVFSCLIERRKETNEEQASLNMIPTIGAVTF